MIARRLALWAPLAAALAVVFYLSSLSHVPGAEYFWDKVLHTAGYGAISILALRAFLGGFGPLRPRATAAAFVFMTAWFVSDEIHQSFVPGRDASVLDIVADIVGFVLAVAVWRTLTAARGPRLTL